MNVSTSDWHVVCGSDTAQGFIDAEEANGHAVDNIFFKYMCGMQNFDCLLACRHCLHVLVHLLHVGQSYLKKRRKTNTYDEMLASVRYELKQKYRELCVTIT